jgi:hypothetical protein
VHVPGRFWHTGQERLCQRVYEREQRLLSDPRIANFSRHSVQARGDPLFRRIDTAVATGEIPLDCLSNERVGV